MHVERTFDKSDGSERIGAAREFIWNHWLQGKCGDLLVRSYSREGQGTDFQYKLTPNAMGATILDVNIGPTDGPLDHVVGRAVLPSGEVIQPARAETIHYRAIAVERIKMKNRLIPNTAKPIVGTGHLSPAKYALRFKDEHGSVIGTF